MRAFVFEDGFSLHALRLAERPIPKPSPRQALVRVRANSPNYRDLVVAEGGIRAGDSVLLRLNGMWGLRYPRRDTTD